ncbi:hypothetical protein ATJ97_3839 [Georgenia soli]|uniref:Uncharacterized protein n=1 Tax=Georgenia soli TaxID=638953 RepID=A0A2A9ERX1_9MICO|nr:hypothetical protein [Georgenia soli]PFG41291.1 hypothetical protein ATJ97_3839 [Georgenia soli]
MARPRYVRDWRLPPGWRAQRDTSVFGDGGAPLFDDPWDVLDPPGGEVSVAVLEPEALAPALPHGRRPGERRPPTLLLERRALTQTPGKVRKLLRTAPPVAPGLPVRPGHRTVTSGHGQVAMLSTRPWDAGTGPDVRVVAVVVPKWSRDAVVLTLTWDDEAGMAELERLAERVVEELQIVTEEVAETPRKPAKSSARRRRSGARPRVGAVYPPPDWVGTRLGGRPGDAAAWLTRAVRRLFGPRSFRRATRFTWVAFGVTVGALMLTEGRLLQVALLPVVAAVVLLPVLLAWRAWTVVHGLLTDGRGWSAPLPDSDEPRDLVQYLPVALLLGAIVLGPTVGTGAAPWHLVLAAWVDVLAHAVLLVLECGRGPALRLRARWDARQPG